MNAISHDADLGIWVADLEQAIAKAEKLIASGKSRGVQLSRTRPGAAWVRARDVEPDFMAGIEHCQMQGIALNLKMAQRLKHLLLGQPMVDPNPKPAVGLKELREYIGTHTGHYLSYQQCADLLKWIDARRGAAGAA